MSPTSKLQVRPATINDIPALADIGYNAFFNEPIDGHWFPFKEQYPHDYHRSFIDELSLRLVTPGNVIMVVELEDQDASQRPESAASSKGTAEQKNDPPPNTTKTNQEVVAYIVTIRHGLSDSSPKLQKKWNPDTPVKKLTRTFLNLPGSTTSLHNRAMSATTVQSYYSQAASIYNDHMEHDSSGKAKGWIDCRFLAVHPTHQLKGYGEKLIEWVAHTAAVENVPVFLDTTDVALPLYVRYGARVIGAIQLPEQIVHCLGGGRGGGNVKRIETLEVKVLKWKREWATSELVARARL
ncbi:hypothetical protein V8F33_012316 [Rhypophila sp. PSN 637]